MHAFQPLPIDSIEINPFTSIGADWALVTAECKGKVNAMTIAWGGVGVLWNKNVAFIFIRDSRYTKELVDGSNTFSITFFGGKEKNALKYFGRVSGREEDKIQNSGFHVDYHNEIPFIDEGNFVLACKKIAAVKLDSNTFLDETIDAAHYADHDYHTMYVGEIVDFLGR
ncbi:MAG: flavin reductase [Lachnospiraceae bacterium]